jgi:predicted TIM-barrel fold metal-dependent hydrolase
MNETAKQRLSRRALLSSAPLAAAGAPGLGRIDCQSHLFVPEFLDWMEKRKTSPYVYRSGGDRFVVVGPWTRKLMPRHADVAAKLADMDRAGIQMTALSINDPGPELFGKESISIARMLNDYIASVAKQHPARFFGLAVLPYEDSGSTLTELERAVDKLGMKGVLLYSNLSGVFPDEPRFRPLFSYAEKRGIPLLLHPACPTTFEATRGYSMEGGLGLMFDTTIALTRIILAGILEEQPALKLVCPHVGGALPYLVGRVDHQTMVLRRGAEHIRKAPSEYLKQVWFDTVSPIAMAIRYGIDFAGAAKMLYASDHPWVDPVFIAGLVEGLGLSASDSAKIFSGNARRLFGITQ